MLRQWLILLFLIPTLILNGIAPVYALDTYTITYDDNGKTGGSVPIDVSAYLEGDTVTVLGNNGTLEKTHFVFVGWNTEANGTGTTYTEGDRFSMGTESFTLYAQWEQSEFSITYMGNGSTGGTVPTDGNYYQTDDPITVLENSGTLVRPHYSFTGWNTVSDGTGTVFSPGDSLTVEFTDIILYAQWQVTEFSITYDGNGNTGGTAPVDAVFYETLSPVTILGNTEGLDRTHFTFTGWNTAANGTGTAYSQDSILTMAANDLTLYAQWQQTEFAVTYDGNSNTGGAVPVDGDYYETGNPVTVLNDTGILERTHWVYQGWNTAADGSGSTYIGGDIYTMGASDITLYAKWHQTEFIVTYHGNGSTGGTAPLDGGGYQIGDPVIVLGNAGFLVRPHYIFTGWNTAADGSGTSYTEGNTLNATDQDIHLFAQWQQTEFIVTYLGNGNTQGTVPVDDTVYHSGDTITVLHNTGNLRKTESNFVGWNTMPNGGGTDYIPGAYFQMGSTDVTLYAKWERETTSIYTVTYNGNGNTSGDPPIDYNNYTSTQTVTVLGNTGRLMKNGSVFAGWNTKSDGSGTTYKSGGDTFNIQDTSVTLYAMWSDPETVIDNPHYPVADVLGWEEEYLEVSLTTEEEIDGILYTTVTVDRDSLLEQINNGNSGITFSIHIDNTSGVAIGKVDGQILESMADNGGLLAIRTPTAIYTLPAQEIPVAELCKQFGPTVNPEELFILIEITQGTPKLQELAQLATKDHFTLLSPPIDFNIRAAYGDKSIPITAFNQYVTRTIVVPEGTDPTFISTGILIHPDGSVVHIPTELLSDSAHTYAQLRSMTNSLYALISHPVTFSDVEDHWSKGSVDNMASRMILNGVNQDSFQPELHVTRAEFASILVRGMALPEKPYSGRFTDIMGSEWYAGAVETASAYGILHGYADRTILPDKTLTREEAMTMIYTSMRTLIKGDELSEKEAYALLSTYKDSSLISPWALLPAASCVHDGIVQGMEGEIRPREALTRGQAAALVERMLLSLKLISPSRPVNAK